MIDLPNSKKYLLTSDLEPEDLRAILERIDENLAFWQVLNNDLVPPPHINAAIPDLPALDKLYAASYAINMSSAPLRTSLGVSGIKGFGLRLSNLVIRIFGTEQISFNRQLREYLDQLIPSVVALYGQVTALRPIISDLDRKVELVADLESKVQLLEASNAAYQQEIDGLARQVATLRRDLDRALDRLDDAGHVKPI
jgi:hypothetical protein